MVLTSSSQSGGSVTLQTVPLTTVLANGDGGHGSPPRVILHTVPSTSPGGKDVLTIQTASLATGTGGSVSGSGMGGGLPEGLLMTSLASAVGGGGGGAGGVTSAGAGQPGSLNGLTRLVTLNANGQPMVAQQPGTVIATVLKPAELHGLSVKEEILDPFYLQTLVNGGDPGAGGIYIKEETDDGNGVSELSYRTVILTQDSGVGCVGLEAGAANGHLDASGVPLASSPSEGLTPVEELEGGGETKEQVVEVPVTVSLPTSDFIQIKTEMSET